MATITDAKCWMIPLPAIGGYPGLEIPVNWTVTRVHAYVVGGTSAALNIEERSSIGTPGTDVCTAELTATTAGAFTTTLTNPGLAAGNTLWLDVSGAVGSPSWLVVTMRYTYDI